MIIDKLNRWERVAGMHPAFKMVFDFIGRTDFSHMPAGRIALDGEKVFINLDEPEGTTREEQVLEVHRRYIDIHVPLKDVETIGWAPLTALKYPHGEYDEEKDVCFYGDSATSLLHVRVGQIAIFFPEDAHAPNIGTGNHRKLCIKIPLLQ